MPQATMASERWNTCMVTSVSSASAARIRRERSK
jgi:hypothetical protein